VQIINQIAVDKFPVLVTRIIQKLHLRSKKYFTDDEEEQLKTLLPPPPPASQRIQDTSSTDPQNNTAVGYVSSSSSSNSSYLTESLRLVLGCISYIYEQAAFTSTGPEPLYQILLDAGLKDPHAKVERYSL